MADLSGTWLGTYWQNDEPTRFEMTLAQNGSALTGSILDDGGAGEAQVAGEVVGRTVQFSKRYLTSSPFPIDYSGTVSEDENVIQGTWKILGANKKSSGTWEARRSGDDLMAELQKRIAQSLSVASR